VLEAALVVARLGEQADPREPAPASLRRFLTFRRFPPRALEAARRVLDDDDGFRARVRAAVDDDAVGEAGRLFLDRPAGWADELAALRARRQPGDVESEVPRLRRELDRTRQALVRAEAAGAEARREVEAARQALDVERAARRSAEAAAATAAERADTLDEARRTALGNLRDLEARHAERTAAWRAARAEVEQLEAERVEAAAAERARGEPDGPSVDPTGPGGPRAEPGPDRAALAAAVVAAAAAAADLSAALAEAAALVGPPAPAAAPTPLAAPSDPRPPPRRVPTPLPKGMVDDGHEAAAHLSRVPGMVVLVDGYNVSIGRWSVLRLDQQRARLVDVLGALHARTGAEVVVVFDGADVARTGLDGRGRGVQVRFTAPDVEADDVLLDAIGAYPLDRPVTVVSDDRRVRDGARRRGANVLAVDQLLAAATG
jgi:predicted RNA-binding protein with PIN domain